MSRVLVKLSSIKLKIVLLFRKLFVLLISNYLFLSIGLIIFIFSLIEWYFIFIYIIYLIYLFIIKKEIIYCLITISIIFLLSFIINNKILSPIKDKYYETNGIIINIKEYDDYNKVTILNKFNKYIFYDSDKLDYEISDKIIVSGEIKTITSARNEYAFNGEEYYYGIRCKGIFKNAKFTYNSSINIFTIRKYLYRYINKLFNNIEFNNSNTYIKALVLGDSSNIYSEDLENIEINGISHLFAISGLHISLLISILTKLFTILKIKEKNILRINTIFLMVYIVITNFSPSVLRASGLYIFNNINNKYNLKLKSIDIISILFIIFIIINPSFIYNLSFKLSFLAAFFIIIISSLVNKIKNEFNINSIFELILITLLLQLLSFPIVINLNNKINLLSIITNSIFITYMSYILLPSIFLTSLIPFLKYILEYIIKLFLIVNNFSANYLTYNIYFPSFKRIEIFVFYILMLLLLFIIKTRKNIKLKKFRIISYLIIICTFLIYYNKSNLNINGKMYFLDLYEGDCTIIDLPFNKGVIIIDTGTGENESVSSFLRSHGIRKIDAIILTHNHNDHYGEANYIINNFKVKEVIKSKYDKSYVNPTILVSRGDVINICDIDFTIYNPDKSYSNINSESIVMGFELNNLSYLFLGDAPIEIENEIMNMVKHYDIVKVGHHGSNTSSSSLFYNKVNPSIVIIMTGQVTNFSFPSTSVINILSKYEIYRTDLDYEIELSYNKNRYYIKKFNTN